MSIPCPRVAGSVSDFGAEHPEKYHDCTPLPLRRHWLAPDAMPVEGGVALVGAAAEGLSFYTRYVDSDIFSTATADDQKMWTLGDVAEVFVKPGVNRNDYWELHVTPNDFIMDIHIPDRARFQAGKITWNDVIAPSSGATRRTGVFDGHWCVELCVPWSAFDCPDIPAAGATWQFAVCRYNYNGGLDNPEHSSTAPLTNSSFHHYEDFDALAF